jgi:excisionase family DNA binding protein
MSNDCAPGEKLLTKGEVAQFCRVEIRTVDRWVAAGKIKCYRTPGGRLLFRNRDVLMTVDRWVERIVHSGRRSAAPSVASSGRTGPASPSPRPRRR